MDNKKLKIAKNLKVGALDAETDTRLLDKCFVDKGDLHELLDIYNPASIVLGRTGSGKSALLYKLQHHAYKSVKLDPNDISIRFLEHSDIINFFDALDIKLDLFYRLLWRHILTVEFLKLRYGIKNEQDGKRFTNNILNLVNKDKAKRKAIDYFNEWGDKFWLDTDEHLKEITQKIENDTKKTFGLRFEGLSLSVEGVKKLSDQERVEVKQRASQVVNGLQIGKLNEVLELLSEHSFDDLQKKYYIIIDQLDEDWANTDTRCRFIRALIEEIKSFRKIQPVKIVVALRKDLLDLVFDKTRDSGFQEEKYESYIMEIRWTSDELKKLLELRINEVFRSQYTGDNVQIEDVFPKPRKGGGQTSFGFIIERTLRRPRDVLQFVNECFKKSSDRDRISWRALQAAEAQYSEKRLKSLKEEWGEMYPSFDDTVEILRGKRSTISRSVITESGFYEVVMTLYDAASKDPCSKIARKFMDGQNMRNSEVVSSMLGCLYRVGVIGVKISTLDTFVWSYIDQSTISKGEIKRSNQIKIHKMLYRALDIVADQNEVFELEDLD